LAIAIMRKKETNLQALASEDYDLQWANMKDFIRYNPGARHRRRLIVSAMKKLHSPPLKVLDAGCGLGATVNELAPVFPDTSFTGIDFSATAIKWCEDTFTEHRWFVADISKPFSLGKFDLVLCTEVIEHLDDPVATIRNLLNQLDSAGSLLVTTPAGRIHQTEKLVGHQQHFNQYQLEEVVRSAGGRIEELIIWGHPGYKALKYLTNVNSKLAVKEFANGKYGVIKRMLMHIFFIVTWATSRRHSPAGVQNICLVRKI
jgi:2-polyprenyl-3-methyl-5-hydroxy-6-metoxy-1,4-benzoquinol methylase